VQCDPTEPPCTDHDAEHDWVLSLRPPKSGAVNEVCSYCATYRTTYTGKQGLMSVKYVSADSHPQLAIRKQHYGRL